MNKLKLREKKEENAVDPDETLKDEDERNDGQRENEGNV
ncbi:unnamed protein product, partial [Rotaria sp. Silwood1]